MARLVVNLRFSLAVSSASPSSSAPACPGAVGALFVPGAIGAFWVTPGLLAIARPLAMLGTCLRRSSWVNSASDELEEEDVIVDVQRLEKARHSAKLKPYLSHSKLQKIIR